MKKAWIGIAVLCLVVGLFIVQQKRVAAEQVSKAQVTATQAPAADQVPISPSKAETYAKKCNFDSDCPHGKCKGGTCGSCNFDSDCKGWGKCKGGFCGSCNFSSDCKGFGDCSGGQCTKSPY